MRIAYDYQIFCGQKLGGISRYITKLATALNESNEVKIIAPIHQNKYLLDFPQNLIYGIGIQNYPAKTGRIFDFINFHLGKRFTQTWRPDIVHETFYSARSTAPHGSPIVLTVYDMIDELFPVKNGESFISAKKNSIARADKIITISESTKYDLINILNIDPRKITTIYLGFDKFNKEIDNSFDLPNTEKPFLLYVGARGGYKNFIGLLKAYAQSVTLKRSVNIVAFGGGGFTNFEHRFISELGICENQVLHVSGDDRTLGEYYSKAVAFIYPSIYEGFGLPPLEAMAHDCPVVSSDSSSMPEVIGNAAVFFNPNRIEDMTYAIEHVVFSQELKSSLVRLGQERLKFFSWNKCASETLDIYKQMTNND